MIPLVAKRQSHDFNMQETPPVSVSIVKNSGAKSFVYHDTLAQGIPLAAEWFLNTFRHSTITIQHPFQRCGFE